MFFYRRNDSCRKGRRIDRLNEWVSSNQAEHQWKGPCEEVLRNITIQSDGNVSPCCGLVDRGLRVFYGSIHEKPLPELLRKANSSTLYNWLALEGPEGLKSAIESKAPHEPFLGRYLQNSQLCQEIFSSKKKMETLLERMPVKAKALSKNRLEHEVLRSAYKEAK